MLPSLRSFAAFGLVLSFCFLYPSLSHQVSDVLLQVIDACAHLIEWLMLRNTDGELCDCGFWDANVSLDIGETVCKQ